ncbi:DUF4311 domain-containing protein [Sporolactobacillus inulinus]|uniref:DUF4311 domain-containing protein n=1 Tax=Sporolactobacillus inulinus TaxID=2078 RepID=UPI00114515CE|nr:DUF4311 domain-containing protein [Sporolactobacillus inulinus]GEB76296.1 membrane protein [Sporolactobacillus inulinus]
MTLTLILIESIIIGGLVGFAAGAGAARMFHAPTVQGMGSFRTLGELNACAGDSASHFSFGLGFFFNAWASAVGAGTFSQDVSHRIIPNWAAAVWCRKGKPIETTLHNPKKMAISGMVVGIIVVSFLNLTSAAIPQSLQAIAIKVLVPAANLLINPVMPVLFWLAALDAGKRTGVYGTIFGGLAHLIMGNAVPGVVLGILIGKGVDENGWGRLTTTLFVSVIILFVLSGFFRGFDLTLLQQFKLGVPGWLQGLHQMMGAGGK